MLEQISEENLEEVLKAIKNYELSPTPLEQLMIVKHLKLDDVAGVPNIHLLHSWLEKLVSDERIRWRERIGDHFEDSLFGDTKAANVCESDRVADNLRGVSILYFQYIVGMEGKSMAEEVNCSRRTIYSYRKRGLRYLRSIIIDMEKRARQIERWSERNRLRDRIPVNNNQLFGFDATRAEFEEAIWNNKGPIFSVDGIHGVGKTALVSDVASKMVDQDLFDDVAWIDIRKPIFRSYQHHGLYQPESMTTVDIIQVLANRLVFHLSDREKHEPIINRLRNKLHKERCLIVINNVDDPAVLSEVYDVCSAIQLPSQLIVSTVMPFNLANVRIACRPLNEQDSTAFLEYYTHHREIDVGSDRRLVFDKIIQTTRGIPSLMHEAINQLIEMEYFEGLTAWEETREPRKLADYFVEGWWKKLESGDQNNSRFLLD